MRSVAFQAPLSARPRCSGPSSAYCSIAPMPASTPARDSASGRPFSRDWSSASSSTCARAPCGGLEELGALGGGAAGPGGLGGASGPGRGVGGGRIAGRDRADPLAGGGVEDGDRVGRGGRLGGRGGGRCGVRSALPPALGVPHPPPLWHRNRNALFFGFLFCYIL